MTVPLDADHPWPGPDSFRTQDAPFFRGREKEIQQLLNLIRRARSVVLYGASGLGKTSLINAGIIPRLANTGYFAVPIRLSYIPNAPSVSDQLQSAIVASHKGTTRMPKPRPQRTAWELLHLRDEPIEGAQPLIIFDQFEELFTIGSGTPQAAQLVEELKGLIEGVPPMSVRARLEQFPEEARLLAFQRNDHRVLISIREDFLYGLESLRAHIPSIIHNRSRIGPLTGGMAIEVVTQRQDPQAEGDGEQAPVQPRMVEMSVAELIVRTVASSVLDERPLDVLEVEPALLSVLCTELALRRTAGTTITKDLVTGSRADIITTFYERALKDVPSAVRAFIEDQLVTTTGFRTSAVLAEALAVPGFTREVLSDLVDKRLLRVIERSSGKWIELTHDILTEIAVHSRKLRQDRLREQQAQLARAAQERTRRKRVLLVLGSLLLAVAVLGRSYLTERSLRKDAIVAKHAWRWQFIDASLREGRYREALAQVSAVVKGEPNAAWAGALAGDLLSRRGWPLPASPMFPDGPFTFLDCSVSGTRCAAAYRDGRVLVRGDISRDLVTGQNGYGTLSMSADGARLVYVPENPGSAIQWTFGPSDTDEFRFPVESTWNEWWASADGQVIVLPHGDSFSVWRTGNRTNRSHPGEIQRHIGNAPFDLSRDGKWLAYLAYKKDQQCIVVAEVGGHELLSLSLSGTVTRLRIDPTRQILAAAFDNGMVRRWTLPDGHKLDPIDVGRPISGIQFNNKGDQLALRFEGGGVSLWSERSPKPQVLMPSSGGVMSLNFAPDDQWLVIATRDGVVAPWSASGVALGEPMHHDGLAFAHALENRGLLSVSLAGGSARWTIPALRAPWNYNLKEPVRMGWFLSEDDLFALGNSTRLTRMGNRAEQVPVSRRNLFASTDLRNTATAYTNALYVRQGFPSRPYTDESDTELAPGVMDYVAFSGDGKRLATGGGGKGYLFDVMAKRAIGAPIEGVSGLWLNDSGTTVAMTRPAPGLSLWRCGEDGYLTKLEDIPSLVVSKVAFNRTSDALVLVTENQARVWSMRDHRFTGRTVMHDGPILDAGFSPDGRWIVTSSEDKRARLWEAASGFPASDWFEHAGAVTSASFSPSGRKLLTTSVDGQIRIWDLWCGGESTEREQVQLGRLAEILSGMYIEPATHEALPAPHAGQALQDFRRTFERDCPGLGSNPPGCASATSSLIRSILGRTGSPETPSLPRDP